MRERERGRGRRGRVREREREREREVVEGSDGLKDVVRRANLGY